MVNSRSKGARGEYLIRDLLRQHTGLKFERVPQSGALSYLKGDLYVPGETNLFCIEAKNYQESPLNDKIFTNKSNYLVNWWEKLQHQARGQKQDPLLFFKYSRSKVFVVYEREPIKTEHFYISKLYCYVSLAEDWLTNETVNFII